VVDESPVRLEEGDVVVFPQGDRHVLSSHPGMRGMASDAIEGARTRQLPIAVTMGGGGAERVNIICGFLGCDSHPFNPLLATLPRMIHLPRRSSGGVLELLVKLALTESSARSAGSEASLARLSELLFVEVVRRHLATLPAENAGWLAGLRDESIGRALARLHDRPAHPWTLETLAREAGMSRSVLAERFTHFVGMAPMQYLARWRMQLTSNLLGTTSLGLAEIAERVGYGSEAALSRAYKRGLGVAPADWRRGKRRAPGAPAEDEDPGPGA
jgi:AraC-like DNA-binding protein